MAGSKTILIVEDDRPINAMYARALTHTGYSVDSAYTGADGLAMAQAQSYDLILLDIMLPEPDGISILHTLRQDDGQGLPNTRIVIITNLTQSKASQQALQKQADGYIIKANVVPSQLTELVAQVLA